MHHRVLIVGTVPYNQKSTSRAFDAYFHEWEKENLVQIFSNAKTPCKGHCSELYQITDHRMLDRLLGKRIETGKIFYYDDLPDVWTDNRLEVNDKAAKAYKIGSKHSAGTHLLRALLWQKKNWCTDQLKEWLDRFQPECVFLAFSDDFFIPQIALYVAERYDIPIVSCIGDDYYFNLRFTLNPLYWIYKLSYRRFIRKIFHHRGSAIYISDKIRDKYNSAFGMDGDTVYLTSEINRKPFAPIDRTMPKITYFGNIRMGRNRSLVNIADSLSQVDPKYRLEVYSNENDLSYCRILQENPHIVYGGSVPYRDVCTKISQSDITVIVEGFRLKDINLSRYSLSTKAADALASGCAILAYGSSECGIIEYMKSIGAAMVCTDPTELTQCIRKLIEDTELQQKYYHRQIAVFREHHNLEISCATAQRIINGAIDKSETNEKV